MRIPVLLLLCTLAFECVAASYADLCHNAADPSAAISSHPALVVWTYDSFEGSTDESVIFGNYSITYNVKLTDIVICRKHSNALVDAIRSIPSGFPAPDVVLGLDNVLEFLAPQSNFTDFHTSRSDQMLPILNTLGHFEHMKPFDYGLIGIYFNITVNPELYAAENNHIFNLPWFINSTLIHKLVAISPLQDTAGLAFLMWTIAELGDPVLNITGQVDYPGGWRSWWTSAFQQHVTIADSWGDAFTIFESDSNIVNMMVSYGSSPAYDWCPGTPGGTWQTRAITSWYDNSRYGWAQIEAVALLHNSTNAWNFIDYILSPPFQADIPLSNFMNPVNSQAAIPDCYRQSIISPPQATLLNSRITSDILNNNLTSILNDWQSLKTQYYSSNITIPHIPNPTPSPSSTGGSVRPNMSYMLQPMMMTIMGLMMVIVAAIM